MYTMLTDAMPPKMASTFDTFGKTMDTEQVATWKQTVQMMLNFVEKFSFPVVIK